jgi:hypothetical protein
MSDGFCFPPNSTSDSGFTRSEPLISVQQLKERYLFGIPLTDMQGNTIPDSTIQHQINAALSSVEHTLDLIIIPTTFTERYDYRASDYTHFNFLQLKKRPIQEVTIIKAKFPNNRDLVTYPKEWYVVEHEAAQIQLSPVEGTFSGLIVTQGGSYVPLIYGVNAYWPHLFEITYKAGFCDEKIPIMLNEIIGLQAALKVFEILADVVHGPGISSENVGLDGASVSKGLNVSSIYSVYSARIESYKKTIKEQLEIAKKYYNAIPSIVG